MGGNVNHNIIPAHVYSAAVTAKCYKHRATLSLIAILRWLQRHLAMQVMHVWRPTVAVSSFRQG